MKYLIIAFMLIASVAWADDSNIRILSSTDKGVVSELRGKQIIDTDSDWCNLKNSDERDIFTSGAGNVHNGTHQLQKCDIVIVRQINRLEKEIKAIHEDLKELKKSSKSASSGYTSQEEFSKLVQCEGKSVSK